jgi:hypothetical protein
VHSRFVLDIRVLWFDKTISTVVSPVHQRHSPCIFQSELIAYHQTKVINRMFFIHVRTAGAMQVQLNSSPPERTMAILYVHVVSHERVSVRDRATGCGCAVQPAAANKQSPKSLPDRMSGQCTRGTRSPPRLFAAGGGRPCA